MERLSRFGGWLSGVFRRKSRDYRKEFKDMTYDIKHVQKKTLTTVYNTIVVISCLGTSFTYVMYNTFYKEKRLETLILKVNDKPIPLNDDLELLALREWNSAHVQRRYKLMGLLNYFPCKGSDIVSVGDLTMRTGVEVGLPHNFTYKSVDDVKLGEVMLSGQSLSDSTDKSKAMKKLIESLVLSEKAKRFAITREIHFANEYRVMTEAVNILFSTMAAVGVGQQIILSMNIRRKYLLSFMFRISSLVLGLGVWFLIRQSYIYHWNLSADEAAVAQGADYHEGAIEYYQKLIQRNAALYRLLGTEGPKRYTKDGETKGLFTTVPSLKKRLQKITEMDPQLNSDSESFAG